MSLVSDLLLPLMRNTNIPGEVYKVEMSAQLSSILLHMEPPNKDLMLAPSMAVSVNYERHISHHISDRLLTAECSQSCRTTLPMMEFHLLQTIIS
jgi:hypothetical protein